MRKVPHLGRKKMGKHERFSACWVPPPRAGGGNQGAIPPAVFQSLKDWWSEPIEAFASPLKLGF